MGLIKCKNCGKEVSHHAKGMCTTCYKRIAWKQEPKECKRCHRVLPHHAKGYCAGCYNVLFNLDKAKAYNYKKWYNIDSETYNLITKKCIVCGFDSIVDLHHIDKNKKNNSESNLIGLCPNHHRMIHLRKFRDEFIEELNEILKKQNKNQVNKNDIFTWNNSRK
jgi:hypothetical protein